jgi:multiple sugar transport system permease protein
MLCKETVTMATTEAAGALPPHKSTARRREAWWGYFFMSPWLIGFFALTLGPGLASLVLTFTRYNVLRPPEFAGLDNYVKVLTQDELFYPSIARTFYFSALFVPLAIGGSLVVAMLLNSKVHGTVLFRTLFFMPSLVPVVAAAVLWTWLFNADWGIVNQGLRALGLPAPGWFSDRQWALPTLVLMSLWGSIGGTRMIIFLAGLQGVPEELYDAAAIDGANAWQRSRHVTLPLITPTIFFNLVLGIISALQVFTSAFVATRGGPSYATWFIGLHIYKHAFEYFNMGYACTLAWLFAIVIITLTIVQQRLSSRWVFYYGG